mmetsp:Transcript_106215/g.307405  ORF Transcript_106215/g.307405 Transcript_106215/m.307405 type:complete len:258 (+) Transcript_106215:54-827(+)
MLQQALAWGSNYVDGLLFSYRGCCCSGEVHADAQGATKCGDVVVMSEWDTDERARNAIGYTGHLSDPKAATLAGFSSASASPCSADGARDPHSRNSPQTPRAAAKSSRSTYESSSPLGCGVPADRDPDEGSSTAAARETLVLRELMKRFVQEMVHGRELPVVIGDGGKEPCKLTLTPNLMFLQLEASGVTHDIPLRNVKDICPGKLQSSKLVPIELDDLCDTLVLRNNECVTFRLSSIKERDEFTKCLKVLALALDQ